MNAVPDQSPHAPKVGTESSLDQLQKIQEELAHYRLIAEGYRKDLLDLMRRSQESARAKQQKRTLLQRLTDRFGFTQHWVINAIRASGELDCEWYRQQYPDVAKTGRDPIEHYVLFGAKEGRMPSPYFDTAWYLTQYPDIALQGMNPLLHYIRHGKSEGRSPRQSGPPKDLDPFLLERLWLQQARDENARLAAERLGRLEQLVDSLSQSEAESAEILEQLHVVQEALEDRAVEQTQTEENLVALEHEREALQRERASLEMRVSVLLQQSDDLQKSRDEFEALTVNLQGQIAALIQDGITHAAEADLLLHQLHNVQELLERVGLESSEKDARIATLESDKVVLTGKVNEMLCQFEVLQNSRDDLVAQTIDLQEQISNLVQERATREAEAELLLAKLHDVQEALEQRNLESGKKDAWLATLEQEKVALVNSLAKAENQLSAVAAELDAVKAIRDDQTKLATERQTRVDILSESLRALEAERAALKTSRDTLTQQSSALATELDAVKAIRDDQTKLATERQTRVDTLSESLRALEAERAALQTSRDTLAQQSSALAAELDAVKLVRDEQAKLATERRIRIDALTQSTVALEQAKVAIERRIVEAEQRAESSRSEFSELQQAAEQERARAEDQFRLIKQMLLQ